MDSCIIIFVREILCFCPFTYTIKYTDLLQLGLLLLDDLVAGAALLDLLEQEPGDVQHLLQVVRLLELDMAHLVAVHPLEQVEEHGVLHFQLHLLFGRPVPVANDGHHTAQLHHLTLQVKWQLLESISLRDEILM